MRVTSPNDTVNQPSRRQVRPVTLDGHGRTKDGNSISEVNMKIDTRQPRRRAPRKNADQKRGHTVDVTI